MVSFMVPSYKEADLQRVDPSTPLSQDNLYMERGKRDVEFVWQKLKQQQQTCADQTRLESFWKHVISGTPSKPAHSTAKHCQYALHRQDYAKKEQCNNPQCAYDATTLDLTEESATNKLAQALQSPDCRTVKATLEQLQAALSNAAPDSTFSTAKLGKSLLRCFDSRAETCRDLSVSCFTRLLQIDPDMTLAMLSYAVPVLGERLQASEARDPAESSEEVRLKLVQLLSLIMDYAGPAIAAYASEVWTMLTAVLGDPFHEVAMQGCRVSQQLAGALGYRLGATSKQLVAALLPLTTHKRYRVRIAAIQAIRDVMHQGAHEMILEMVAWRDPNVVPIKAFFGDDLKVNFCGKLATDHHVQVRLAFLDMVGNWMLTLRERLDHEPRLLPYILSGLCDDAPAVVEAAAAVLERLGQQYEQEHEKDVADLLRFADQLDGCAEVQLMGQIQAGQVHYAGSWLEPCMQQSDPVTSHAPAMPQQSTSCGQTAAEEYLQQHQQAVSLAAAPAATAAVSRAEPFVLPGPLKQRPRLGSRLLVRGNFSSLLPALCRELSSWQSGPRAMSARLLLVSLLLVESAAEQYLQVILPALCAAVEDVDAGAAVKGCATVLGCFCSLPQLLDLLAPRLEEWAEAPHRQAAGLMLLAAVLSGAAMLDRISNHSTKVLQLLVSLGVASSQDSTVRAAMMQLVAQLVAPTTVRQLMGDKHSQKPCSLSSAGMQPAEAAGCRAASAATLCSSSDAGEVRAPSCHTEECAASEHGPLPGPDTAALRASSSTPSTVQLQLMQLLQQLYDSSPIEQGNTEHASQQDWLAGAMQLVRQEAE